MSSITDSIRALGARVRGRRRGPRTSRRVYGLLSGTLAIVVSLSLTSAGGTAALWTGSVSIPVPALTAGGITASVNGFSDLSTSYTSGALDRTSAVSVANQGTVGAQYTATVTLAMGSSSALASATTVTIWQVAAAADCTSIAAPSGAVNGSWTAVPQLTGTLAAGQTAVYCFRTRLPSTSLATAGSLTASLRVDLAVPNTGWTSTAAAHATQSVTADRSTLTDYIDAVRGASALHYWRLGEPDGRILYDWVGTADAYTGTGVTRAVPGALLADSNTATAFSGDANGTAGTRILEGARSSFAVEAWVKTSTTSGGTIVGFGDASTGTSTSHGRSLYMDGNGRIYFGVNPGTPSILQSSTGFNNGAWHHIVGQLGPNGQELYIDGTRVANSANTGAGSFSGYWRIGGDTSWAGDRWFDGTIDEVAVYGTPLSSTAIASHRNLSGRGSFPLAPDPYGASVSTDSPTLFWRLNDAGDSSVAADSSGNSRTGGYSGNVTKPVTGAVAGTRNAAASFNGTNGLVAASQSISAPSVYSTELWFKTTSTSGGKLIGFGSASSGLSTTSDRHVYLQNDGKLTFGVKASGMQTITSTAAYNDGRWHHVVATQSAGGMVLYVDGQQAAAGPVATAEAGTGYWRVGGDSLASWPSAPTSSYVTAEIDEVAVYSSALTVDQVKRHYSTATGAPAASFTSTINGMIVNVDGSASADYDGTLSSYSWNWGDSTPTSAGPTATHTYTAPGTYTITLTVTDNAGRTDTWTRQVTTTDTAPPSTPSAPTVTSNTGTTVGLSWPAATDNIGVTGYDIFRGGAFVTTVSGTIWTDTGRALGTTYTYAVRARDGAGNVSGTSSSTAVTTHLMNTQVWYQIRNVVNDHCLTAASQLVDRSYTQSNCATPSSSFQAFKFTPAADGALNILVRADPSVGLRDLPPGASITGSTLTATASHLWTVSRATDGHLRIVYSNGQCIDYGNTSPGSSFAPALAACSPSKGTQQLKLVEVVG